MRTGFYSGNLMWRDHLEDLRIDSRVLINILLEKQCVCEDVDWTQLA
jgi:hypothetical protein